VKKIRTLLKNKDVNGLLKILNIFAIFEEPSISILREQICGEPTNFLFFPPSFDSF